MSRRRSTLTLALVLVGLTMVFGQATAVGTQQVSLPPARQAADLAALQGPATFGRTSSNGTTFTGHADTAEPVGRVTTYRGHVIIAFPDTRAILQADEVAYDTATKELTLSGHVRLKLDSK
jgi:lipopolysaccharide assembly outer membrane protein LptD (OstA)